MKTKKTALKPLATGQIWQFEDTQIEISQVGKRLIHYKRFKGGQKRGIATDLAGIESMENFLKKSGAKLVRSVAA